MNIPSTHRRQSGDIAPEKQINPDVRDGRVLPPPTNGKYFISPQVAGMNAASHGNKSGAPGGKGHLGLTQNHLSDEQLIESYRNGDRASFTLLVERYHREVFHFLVRFLSDRAAAEDIFQETFLQIHQSAAQFDLQRRFRPWLFTIAANKARDLMRSQSRRPANPLQAAISPHDDGGGQFIDLMASAEQLPSAQLEQAEVQEQVRSAVQTMPEHLREILLLSYFHQFPYKQISEILEIPLGTVKSRLHAAVASFAEAWRNMTQNRHDMH